MLLPGTDPFWIKKKQSGISPKLGVLLQKVIYENKKIYILYIFKLKMWSSSKKPTNLVQNDNFLSQWLFQGRHSRKNEQSSWEQQIHPRMTNSAQNDKVSPEWQPYPWMTLGQNKKSAPIDKFSSEWQIQPRWKSLMQNDKISPEWQNRPRMRNSA